MGCGMLWAAPEKHLQFCVLSYLGVYVARAKVLAAVGMTERTFLRELAQSFRGSKEKEHKD